MKTEFKIFKLFKGIVMGGDCILSPLNGSYSSAPEARNFLENYKEKGEYIILPVFIIE